MAAIAEAKSQNVVTEKSVFEAVNENSLSVYSVGGEKPDSQDGSTTPEKDWTPEEETRLVWKVDFIVMPFLILGFMALQFDRGNIGNALTDFFFRDVGITQAQFNVGQQLLSLGIVLLEIPSNIVLYRVGPTRWITGQIFIWGLIATFQAFQKGVGAFYATRILLGLAESGFIPAGLYTITLWYKRDETSKRFAFYFLGNLTAQASSGLIAYGILQMRGLAGLAGWQWLFILEGIFTILVSVIFGCFFAGTPAHPYSLLKLTYFSPRELHILRTRVLLDDPDNEKAAEQNISWAEFKTTMCDWRIYPHLLQTICALAPVSTLGSYAPSLVASWGYPRLKSNALVSVGAWVVIPLYVFWGWVADKTRQRGLVLIVSMTLWWGFALGCQIVSTSTNSNLRYALLTMAIIMGGPWHAVNGSWLAINARSPAQRSLRMAMFIMSANTSGIVGSQLFQPKDAPKYQRGWTVIVCLVSASLVFIIFNNVQYRLSNRAIKKKIARLEEEGSDNEAELKELKLYNL